MHNLKVGDVVKIKDSVNFDNNNISHYGIVTFVPKFLNLKLENVQVMILNISDEVLVRSISLNVNDLEYFCKWGNFNVL